jgi:copper resistance protein D
MLFLSLVLAPLVRRGTISESREVFRSAAHRFRLVVWSAITVLLTTGPILLRQRGIPLADPTQWPQMLQAKIGLVVLLLLLTMTHDFLLGPRLGRIGALPAPISQVSRWLPRVALLLALSVLIAAVMLARL